MLCFIWDFEERSQDKQVEHKDTEFRNQPVLRHQIKPRKCFNCKSGTCLFTNGITVFLSSVIY